MTRQILSGLTVVSAIGLLSAQAIAGPHLLPRIRLPKINMGKAAKAAIYPVTKSVINGGKTVLKTAETAGAVASLAPQALGDAVQVAPQVLGDATKLAPQVLNGATNLAPSTRWNGVAQKIIVGAAKH